MSERLMVEVMYVDHCDEPCGLGAAYYKCPHCGKDVTDYGDGWFGWGESSDFACAECGKPLKREY